MASSSAGSGKGDALHSDTPVPEKSVAQRLDAIENRLDDVQRQISKCCIDFKGPAVRQLPGETTFMMLKRLLLAYWGLHLHPTGIEIANCHFVSKKNAKVPVFVAYFNDRKDESIYAGILNNKPQWNGREKIFANLHLHTANDRRLLIAVRLMKQSGQVSFFRHLSSGRLSVTFSNGKTSVFGKAKDLEKLAKGAASTGIKASKAKKRGKR